MAYLGLGAYLLCISLVALIEAYDNLSKGCKPYLYDQDGNGFKGGTLAVVTDDNTSTCLPSYYFTNHFRGNISTVKVDLTMLQSIYKVDIFKGKGYSNGSVYISTTDSTENVTQCTQIMYGPDPQRFICTDHGRFVILVYEFKDFTGQVCEIKVTGCRAGKFGPDCRNTCPGNCVGKICNILNGKCTMCPDGWKGDQCNQKCADGYFGSNCAKLCKGRCLNGAACNAVTGTCDGGCAPGWRNPDCSEVCSNGFFGKQCAQRCNLSCDPFTGFYSGTVTTMSGDSEQSSEGNNAIVSGLVVALVVSVLTNIGLLVIYCKRYILNGKQTCKKGAPSCGSAELEGSANVQSAREDNSMEATVYYEILDDRTRDQDTQNYSTLQK